MATAPTLIAEQEPPRIDIDRRPVERVSHSLLEDERIQSIARGPQAERLGRGTGVRTASAAEVFTRWRAAAQRRIAAAQRICRSRNELAWLAANHARYAGQWVALFGNELLAAGRSARDVYAAIAGRPEDAVVVRVDSDTETPFAGW